MMKTTAAVIGFMGLAWASATQAFDYSTLPHNPQQSRAFVLNMPGDVWLDIVRQSMDFSYLIGKPYVVVVNATDEPIHTIMCDGRWQLLGSDPYIKGAPSVIGPHKIGILPTKDFDGYCKQSIVGLTQDGDRHDGILSIPGDFTHSTSITFK